MLWHWNRIIMGWLYTYMYIYHGCWWPDSLPDHQQQSCQIWISRFLCSKGQVFNFTRYFGVENNRRCKYCHNSNVSRISVGNKIVGHPDGSWSIACRRSLHWRHNDHNGVSNHQPHGCLLNRLFGRRSKKTSKVRVTGLCAGSSPGTGEIPKMSPFDDVIMCFDYTSILDLRPGFNGLGKDKCKKRRESCVNGCILYQNLTVYHYISSNRFCATTIKRLVYYVQICYLMNYCHLLAPSCYLFF